MQATSSLGSSKPNNGLVATNESMQRANSFHYENKVIIKKLKHPNTHLNHRCHQYHHQRLGVSPAMARVDESEDEVRILTIFILIMIISKFWHSFQKIRFVNHRTIKNPHEKIRKCQFQTENDFYLDGDELIMPVYPRHHRLNDDHDHHHDQILMEKMRMCVCWD